MRRLGEKKREKQKQKMSLFRKSVGLCSRSWLVWKQAVTLLRGATRQAARYLRGQRESQAPEESVPEELSGLPSWPLLMRTRSKALGTCGRRETCCGHLGHGLQEEGREGCAVRRAARPPWEEWVALPHPLLAVSSAKLPESTMEAAQLH